MVHNRVVVKHRLIEYIPLQQGLRQVHDCRFVYTKPKLIEYIPLQQGLRRSAVSLVNSASGSLSIFHYNKD